MQMQTNAAFAAFVRQQTAAPARQDGDEEREESGEAAAAMNPMQQAALRRMDAEMREDERDGDEQREHADTPATQEQEAATRKRPLTEAELKRKFTWQKHTKGFGLKMMAKMGFSGRLGKDEKGVSTTIEVVQRPAQMGLGFGSFKEASTLKNNKKVQKELQGEEYDDQEEARKAKEERQAIVEDDTLWRKRRMPTATGRKHRRAADIQAEAHVRKAHSDVILDLRGPDVRVLDKMADAYSEQDRLEASKPKLGEELIYNVRMVVNLAQGRIYDLTQKLDTNREMLENLRKEERIMKAQMDAEELRWSKVETIAERLEKLAEESQGDVEMSVERALQNLREMRAGSPLEFEAYKVVQVVPSLVIPSLRSLLSTSELLDPDSAEAVAAELQQVQLFLLESPDPEDLPASDERVGVFFHIHEKSSFTGEEIYNHVLEEVLWPAVVQMVNIHWDVQAAPTACVAWYERFRPHLSHEFAAGFLHHLVLPRLKKECHNWSPQMDMNLLLEWITPWMPHLSDDLNSIYPDVQVAMGNAINQWHPSDVSIASQVARWRDIWGAEEYAKFTYRHVLPKLARCLHREFQVNPQDQSLDQLQWVLAWKDHLAERQLVALLDGEFFPKWLRVLRRWVCASPNLIELAQWYTGWKRFFDKQGLATHARLVVHFHGALILLEAAANKAEDAATPIPELSRRMPTSYREALAQTQTDQEQSTRSQPAAAPAAPSQSLGLKDVIEQWAIERDLTFLPKGLHDGKQVYILGRHRILIENELVYREVPPSAPHAPRHFEPVDLDELLQ